MAQAPPMRFLKPDNPYNPVGLPDFGPHMLPWAPWSDNPHSPVWQWIDPTGPNFDSLYRDIIPGMGRWAEDPFGRPFGTGGGDPTNPGFRSPYYPENPEPPPTPGSGGSVPWANPDIMQQTGGGSIDPMTPKSAARDWAAPQPVARAPRPTKKRSSGSTKGPSKSNASRGSQKARASSRKSKGK
tara:strand:+ start:4578 stop:5129 length:552 start_codon:yes stop_codon:yes gene_type:complete